jgi:hypothetical protein
MFKGNRGQRSSLSKIGSRHKQDHPIAWSNLGTIYLLGLEDVKLDKKEAARCWAGAQALRTGLSKHPLWKYAVRRLSVEPTRLWRLRG